MNKTKIIADIAQIQERIAGNEKRYKERYESTEKAVNAALASAEKAVSKAEIAADKRFDSINELRGMANDQANKFMNRLEAMQLIDGIKDRMAIMAKQIDSNTGRDEAKKSAIQQRNWAIGILVTIVIAFSTMVLANKTTSASNVVIQPPAIVKPISP